MVGVGFHTDAVADVEIGDHLALAPSSIFPLTPRVSDRLNDLRRQRALAQEQLAWLDREIARETGAVSAPASSPVPHPVVAPAVLPPSAFHADELIEQYAEKEKPV